MQSHHLSHDDYTVGWICALSSEFAAAKAMLDSTHLGLPQASSDHNSYALGEIAGHNVVIACLPAGVYGTTSATSVAKDMLSTYREIRFGLMVGIGGGAPSKNNDIRLGDIVVSQPSGSSGGVIQYDHGKTMTGGRFEPTGSMNKPPALFLNALNNVKSEEILGRSRLQETLSQALERYAPYRFTHPGPEKDILFNSEYAHPSSAATCDDCDQDMRILRTPRDGPRVFYGLVASANQVMKDSIARDRLAREHGILCFEMEAAGLMDHFPCLVIRGICDYSDSHKHKDWQEYAALTAAAYAKCVLLVTSVDSTRRCKLPSQERRTEREFQPTAEDAKCLRALFLTDPEEDRASLRRSRGNRAQGTCEWILETEEVSRWLKGVDGRESCFLWLHGNPGTGKSTMAITLTEEIPKERNFASSDGTLAYFFCDSSHEKRLTATAILRGLLYQLQKQHPHFLKRFRADFAARGASIFDSFDNLWSIFLNVVNDESTGHKYCIIDALDECDESSQHIVLSQLDQYYHDAPQRDQEKLHILITSRSYPEILEYLQSFPRMDLAQYPERKQDIERMISEKVQELRQKKAYTDRIATDVTCILREKAEDTFLWIGIACQELSKVRSRDAVKTLQKLPRGLESLYRELLATAIQQNREDEQRIIEILHFVAVAQIQMTVFMLSEACQSYMEEPDEERVAFFREDIKMCRLMVVIQDDLVSLLHKSVKDFVLGQQKDGVTQSLRVHATLSYRCIDYFIKWAFSGEELGDREARDLDGDKAFLRYATLYWPRHAHLAQTEFLILDEHRAFYHYGSAEWVKWWGLNWKHILLVCPDLDLTSYTILHAAAEWGIVPLAKLGLAMLEDNALGSRSPEYDDQEFKAPRGETPLGLAARRGDTTLISMLLTKADGTMRIGREVIRGAVGEPTNGTILLYHLFHHPLLAHLECPVETIEGVLEVAAANEQCADGIFTVILNHYGDSIRAKISENVVKHAVSNTGSGSKLVNIIAERFPEHLSSLITTGVLESAIFNKKQSFDVLLALLPYSDKGRISERVLETAIRHWDNSREIALLLFSYADRPSLLTERIILIAASHSTKLCHGLIKMTLEDEDKVSISQISTDLYHLIIHWYDLDLINLVLRAMGNRSIVTNSMICAANDENVRHILKSQMEYQCHADIGARLASLFVEYELGTIRKFSHSSINQIAVLNAHTDEVWCSAFSPDGSKFASGGRDKVARVYHFTGFRPVEKLLFHEEFIVSLGWAPNSSKLVSGSDDGTIRIWDAETYGCVWKFQSHTKPITAILWDPNGQSFISTSLDRRVCHWSDAGRALHISENTPRAQHSCMTPDGKKFLLVDFSSTISIFEIQSFRKIQSINLEANASSIQVEPGTNFALLDLRSGESQIVDLVDGRVVQRFQSARVGESYATQSRFFGEGNSLVLGCKRIEGSVFGIDIPAHFWMYWLSTHMGA